MIQIVLFQKSGSGTNISKSGIEKVIKCIGEELYASQS